MTVESSPSSVISLPRVIFEGRERRTVASYERELTKRRRTEIGLRELLAHDEALLGQKDELIQQQTVLSQEFRSQTVEQPANDRKSAFVAKPGVGKC